MTGSARTARCSGRTVTQPAAVDRAAISPSSQSPRTGSICCFCPKNALLFMCASKVGAETADVTLHVFVVVLSVEDHVRSLESKQNPKPQGDQKPPAGAGMKPVAFTAHELVFRRFLHTADADRHERSNGPIRRQIERPTATVD